MSRKTLVNRVLNILEQSVGTERPRPRRRIDLRHLTVRCYNSRHLTPIQMTFLAWDNQGRGWAVYTCPVCGWRKGYAFEHGKIAKKFG